MIGSKLKTVGTCLLFGIITLPGIIFTFLFIKESKGRSKVEIEEELK